MLLKVFLSSTSKDLDPHRKAVDAAIRKLKGLHCVRMEDWTARPDTPRAVCEAEVRESQLFIGILGHCYGSHPPDDERSFTEIEYDAAVAQRLPRLMFVAPDDFPTSPKLLRAESPEQARRQEAFRQRVLSADTAECQFYTADELASRVRDALFNALREHRAAVGEPQPPPAPFTVPTPVGDFQGREHEIAAIEAALSGNGRAVISALSGMGGIGKSQLAYEVVHRLRGRFPDGAVHLDMLGTSAAPLTPEDAMARVLQALSPAARPSSERPALEAAYRQALDGKHLLLLLDNACDTAQVKPLLPPAPVALLVTSRRRIVLPGARPVQLDPLPLAAATALLREILGDAAPDEVGLQSLAEACGRLPLALRAAGTFLLTYGWQVDAYLAALREQRLALLSRVGADDPELDVRAALSLSYDRLAEEDTALAQRFTQLAVFPAGFLPDAAAAIWELPAAKAQATLDTLLARSLLQLEGELRRYRLPRSPSRSGSGQGRPGGPNSSEAAARGALHEGPRHRRRPLPHWRRQGAPGPPPP